MCIVESMNLLCHIQRFDRFNTSVYNSPGHCHGGPGAELQRDLRASFGLVPAAGLGGRPLRGGQEDNCKETCTLLDNFPIYTLLNTSTIAKFMPKRRFCFQVCRPTRPCHSQFLPHQVIAGLPLVLLPSVDGAVVPDAPAAMLRRGEYQR